MRHTFFYRLSLSFQSDLLGGSGYPRVNINDIIGILCRRINRILKEVNRARTYALSATSHTSFFRIMDSRPEEIGAKADKANEREEIHRALGAANLPYDRFLFSYFPFKCKHLTCICTYISYSFLTEI